MSEHHKSTVSASLGVPIAIVIAAALIAGAIVYTGSQPKASAPSPSGVVAAPQQGQQIAPEVNVPSVTKDDHIAGNPNAPIVIVEYSDYDCPFCKNFHETMNQIMTEYGKDGDIAWVYRHFPLPQLHPNAPKLAEASECVAELGGNTAFWEFSDLIFSRANNTATDMTKLPDFASQAGVSADSFTTCLNSGKHADTVNKAIDGGIAAGAQGTPYSVLLVGDEKVVINGAVPIAEVRLKVEAALAKI